MPPTFSTCRKNGQVHLRPIRKRKKILKSSFEFLKNSRAYNEMFAFTSMGGCILYSFKFKQKKKINGPHVARVLSSLF